MPYILKHRRAQLRAYSEVPDLDTAGELNYWFTQTISSYLGKEYNYQKINYVIGALEGAKMEFYRRVVVPYEDKKIQENGDVY